MIFLHNRINSALKNSSVSVKFVSVSVGLFVVRSFVHDARCYSRKVQARVSLNLSQKLSRSVQISLITFQRFTSKLKVKTVVYLK